MPGIPLFIDFAIGVKVCQSSIPREQAFDTIPSVRLFAQFILMVIGDLARKPDVISLRFASAKFFEAATIMNIQEKHVVFNNRSFWICVAIVLVTPLSFLKSLHALRYTSYYSFMAVVAFVSKYYIASSRSRFKNGVSFF